MGNAGSPLPPAAQYTLLSRNPRKGLRLRRQGLPLSGTGGGGPPGTQSSRPTVTRFLPTALLLYIRRSALFTSVSAVSSGLASVAPTETVTRMESLPSVKLDFSTRERSLSAMEDRWSRLTFAMTARNSSPPHLPMTSKDRMLFCKVLPTILRTLSPTSCPCVSLMYLKRSMSPRRTPNVHPYLSSSLSFAPSCISTYRRLPSSVIGSSSAIARSSAIRRVVVSFVGLSLNTSTAPAIRPPGSTIGATRIDTGTRWPSLWSRYRSASRAPPPRIVSAITHDRSHALSPRSSTCIRMLSRQRRPNTSRSLYPVIRSAPLLQDVTFLSPSPKQTPSNTMPRRFLVT